MTNRWPTQRLQCSGATLQCLHAALRYSVAATLVRVCATPRGGFIDREASHQWVMMAVATVVAEAWRSASLGGQMARQTITLLLLVLLLAPSPSSSLAGEMR